MNWRLANLIRRRTVYNEIHRTHSLFWHFCRSSQIRNAVKYNLEGDKALANIFIGVAAMTGLLFVVDYARKRRLRIAWWQWVLTILGFVYAIFVLEVIVSFLAEGTVKGAVVMGVILGFIAVVWGVLLGRFVFTRGAE